MEELNKVKHQYCSQQQKDDLVQLVTEDSDLLTGKLTNKFGYKDSQKKWRLIAFKLNAIPGGQKDWKQWRKTWQDMKSRTKSKKASLNRYERGTGGGPPPIGKITPVEEKVLSIINPTSITGDDCITESQIEFIFEDEDMPTEEFLHHNNFKQDNIVLEVTEEEKKPLLDTPNRTRKRTVAANRLLTSTQATTSLANLSEERLAFEKEKFKFEQQKFEFEKHYCEGKLLIMARQAKALEDLVTRF